MFQPFPTDQRIRLGSATEPPRWMAVWESVRRAFGLQPQPWARWTVGRSVEVTRDELLVHDRAGHPHYFPKDGIREVAFLGRKGGATADLWIWYSARAGRSTQEVYAGTFDVRSEARRRTERRLMKLGVMMDGL